MRPASCKAKGRRAQQQLRDLLLAQFPDLEPDDIKCALMSEGGCDLKLSPAARRVWPYSPEVKNVEKLNFWQAYQQAVDNAKPDTTPIVVASRNRTKPLVVISLSDFLRMS